MMLKVSKLLMVILLLSSAPMAMAGLTIGVVPSSSTYNQGDSGFVDVMIHSDSNDELDSFLLDLNVTGPSGVTFHNPQPESYLTDNGYVFFGRSANIGFNLNATNVTNGGASLRAVDVSYDFNAPPNALPRTIPGAGNPLLLGRFSFLAGGVGDFTVSVDPGSSFSNVNFATFTFNRTPGTFSVSAVPEPSSLTLLGVAVGLTLFRRKRKLLSLNT